MTFEFDGEKYRQASGQQKAWGKKLISELELEGSERILDLGCGDGALTAELAALVPGGSVLGIDASKGMIATVRKNHVEANLQFELHDINTIDFEPQFDVVFSNATLHWIKDHERLLAKVYESLTNSGAARFQFAGDGNCSNLITVLQEVMLEEDYAGYFDEFEWPWFMPAMELYRTLVDESPFVERKVWSESGDKYFESVEAMVQWIDQPSLVPFLGHIDRKDRQRFRNTVVDRMINRTRQSDGRHFETFRRINVLARK